METFSASLALCAGNSPVTGEFPAQRPVTRSFNVFLNLRLNEWLSKQWWGWWFETPSCPLWRHYNKSHAVADFSCFHKKNIKFLHHWPFMKGIIHWPMESPHKGPLMWKVRPRDIMTWSLYCAFRKISNSLLCAEILYTVDGSFNSGITIIVWCIIFNHFVYAQGMHLGGFFLNLRYQI